MSREPKPFQAATAEAAIAAFNQNDRPRRFLVADEVGLGKTVVARAVIQRMLQRRRSPLVVFYVASNTTIAHQNRRRLLEFLDAEKGKDASAKLDRLTLAANPRARPTNPTVQLYTLTPDTSIPLYRGRGGLGRVDERAFIYRLITGRYPSLTEGTDGRTVKSVLKGRAGDVGWKTACGRVLEIDAIRSVQNAFFNEVAGDTELKCAEVSSARLAEIFREAEVTRKPSRLLGRLRNALALAALADVRPDLIIFDEFQKFRDVLIDRPGKIVDPVAAKLRGGKGSREAAVLLLSATPYRHYSSRRDDAEGPSHYSEFSDLIKFLMGKDSHEPAKIEEELIEFRREMLSQKLNEERLTELRDSLQRRLRPVMSRTERAHLLTKTVSAACSDVVESVQGADVRVFKHWTERLREGERSTNGKRQTNLTSYALPYWFSIPYPVQMMGKEYIAWQRAHHGRRAGEPGLSRADQENLRAPESWPHPQLRATAKLRPPDRLTRPWISPSLPWWKLDGPWCNRDDAQQVADDPFTSDGKLLVFSRFKAVPPAVASLLSFGVESHLAGRLGHKKYAKAGELSPLQLKASSRGLLALFFPSPSLIRHTNPRCAEGKTLPEVRKSMIAQVRTLLSDLAVPIRRSSKKRPIWFLLPALEGTCDRSAIANTGVAKWSEISLRLRAAENAHGQRRHMADLLRQWDRDAAKGLVEITEGELAALADYALSSPGVVLGRAWYRHCSGCLSGDTLGELIDLSWNGFRSYLNRAWFKAALTRRGEHYPDAIRRAIAEGNLESVLDEHLWITSRLDGEGVANFAKELGKVFNLVSGRHRVFTPGPGEGGDFSLRCHAAMPFSDAKGEVSAGEQPLRTDDLRRAFNSPFWPHVLVTTSLGQEGLDFHVWCRHLLHWDLPGNPLDLEQREGRIQRFGGLSIRHGLARRLREHVLMGGSNSESPWTKLAEMAERDVRGDASGLSPWWGCDGEAVERQIVRIHQSSHVLRFKKLSEQRLLYRLALGQPHQQDFIENISKLPADNRDQYALCLSAWTQA